MENGVQSWACFLSKRRTGQSIAHGVEQTGPPPLQIINSAIQTGKPKPKHHTYSPIHSTSFHCTPPHPQGQHRPMLVLIVSYVAQRRHAVHISQRATATLCCMRGTRPHHPPHLQDFQTKKNKFWEAHTDTLIKHGHLMCDPPEMEDGYYPYGKVDWKDLKLSYPHPTPKYQHCTGVISY